MCDIPEHVYNLGTTPGLDPHGFPWIPEGMKQIMQSASACLYFYKDNCGNGNIRMAAEARRLGLVSPIPHPVKYACSSEGMATHSTLCRKT